MRLDPPRLTRGALSGKVYIVTHGKVTPDSESGRELIEASVKYDVTDQFEALAGESAAISP